MTKKIVYWIEYYRGRPTLAEALVRETEKLIICERRVDSIPGGLGAWLPGYAGRLGKDRTKNLVFDSPAAAVADYLDRMRRNAVAAQDQARRAELNYQKAVEELGCNEVLVQELYCEDLECNWRIGPGTAIASPVICPNCEGALSLRRVPR